MTETIAIDIDQTLYDFDNQIREAFFEMALESGDKSLLRGAYSTNMEWRNLTDVLGVEIGMKAIERVHDRTLKQVPFANAVNVCQKLALKHKIKYVTSRYDKYYEDTYAWLGFWGFPEGEIICSTHDKAPHLKDCRYLIDDRPKTIIEFVTNFEWILEDKFGEGPAEETRQRKAFGLWTPYNRNLTDIKNVYLAPNWTGIKFYLERKGLI